jgi:hypothetical protein
LLGFVIGTDRYFKRDDCGIIYQVCVAPGARRGLVGAALVKAMFDRAAYGCRLFCCWCAQDLEANEFWESLGFVPLAFRAGSRGKGRVHIFWQKRICAGDTTTPYWFPSQTAGGSIREDRLVLPIPPGTHWRDAKPIILPSTPAEPETALAPVRPRKEKPKPPDNGIPPGALCGFSFAAPPPPVPAKEPKPKPQRVKNDPRYAAAAREIRDRWLEKITREPDLLAPAGKYDLARQLPDPTQRITAVPVAVPCLPAAA